jgi:hypothetical protein
LSAVQSLKVFSCGTIETDPPAWYFNTPRVFNNNSIYTLNIYIHVIRSSSGVGFNNGYYRHKFSAEQIAKMRSIISQREEVSPTIHQKQIIGPKHFSNSGTYSLSVLNADESVRWEVTAYSENGSTKTTYTTSTLTLSSTQPTYYSIVASITSPAGTKSVTTHATCNEPSPYIGSLYWETNQGQYSITDATNYGGTLYVSGNINLSLEYRDKAGNTSDALPGADFMCTTASNRLVRGKTFSLTPADCERDLYIRAKDACGTAESFFVIPCQVTNYYYDVNVALGEVAIGVVKTDNAEVNAILTAQKAKQAVVFNAATDVKIKSVVVYTENRQVLYSKEYAMGVSEIKIDAVSWASGVYHLSISNGTEVRHQKIMIP